MSESQQEIIASLYLPIHNDKLLLPNVSVAEVVDYQEPTKTTDAPDYFLGSVRWRGLNVPVISFEIAKGKATCKTSDTARIAVINAIGPQRDKLPFIAIVTQGIPRLVKVSSELIKNTRKKKSDVDAAIVRVEGEEATIPNIEYLESLAFEHI